MNPTLWGEHRRVQCTQCRVTTRVDRFWVDRLDPKQRLDGSSPWGQCWHCGATWTVSVWTAASECPPDQCRVLPAASFRLGDLVLVRHDDHQHIKRIVGVPGQTISVTADLLGGRWGDSHSQRPRVMVDLSELRLANDARWQTMADPPAIIYQHRNVYRGNRPSPILDDYPGNVGWSGTLHPAIYFGVQGIARPTDSTFRVLFANDHNRRVVEATRSSDAASWRASMRDSPTNTPSFNSSISDLLASLEPHQPIAIIGDTVSGLTRPDGKLCVWREIAYRYDGPTITLGPAQWFVMGDNVPVSVDSRTWGPIDTSNLVGRIELIAAD